MQRKEMIHFAIKELGGSGTKEEIINEVQKQFDLKTLKGDALYNSLANALSRYCTMQPKLYGLKREVERERIRIPGTKPTIKEMLIQVLRRLGKPSEISQIREKMI